MPKSVQHGRGKKQAAAAAAGAAAPEPGVSSGSAVAAMQALDALVGAHSILVGAEVQASDAEEEPADQGKHKGNAKAKAKAA